MRWLEQIKNWWHLGQMFKPVVIYVMIRLTIQATAGQQTVIINIVSLYVNVLGHQ